MNKQKTVTAMPARLLLMPAPVAMEGALRTDEEVARHRRLYCSHYDGCLDLSVREAWGGFSCLQCPLKDVAGHGPAHEPFAHQRRAERLDH
jgi:hypothetical protein